MPRSRLVGFAPMGLEATIVWFRRDLRLTDHAPLVAAAKRGPVIPVFIWSPDEKIGPAVGAASRWWLHRSLADLHRGLRALGLRLILRSGPVLPTLRSLGSETGAKRIVWHRLYEPEQSLFDKELERRLTAEGWWVKRYPGYLLVNPKKVLNQSGRPYQVFSSFWKRCLSELDVGTPVRVPKSISKPSRWPRSESLDRWGLEPTIRWDLGLRSHWVPGETGALDRLKRFVGVRHERYAIERNRVDLEGTSSLSPHLHFGEISPRQVWVSLERCAIRRKIAPSLWRASSFVSELGWREFAAYVLTHFPHTVSEPLRQEFGDFPWLSHEESIRAWQQGKTGYPLVDAGMRQLWAIGWMHNRARMVVASFLVKHLRTPWQVGADWFWDTLVDADLANNVMGWQWTAGCGVDAAPYFRIFNPITQGERFDPDGDYVRRWVPELKSLPSPYLHCPWKAPESVRKEANLRLGLDYPTPMVDHREARLLALEGYNRMKSNQ